MKKFLFASIVVLSLIFFATDTEAAPPAQDTWVLTWNGTDYYVKAGTLKYYIHEPGPEFNCDIVHNGEVHHYEFVAKGAERLEIDGKYYGISTDKQNGRFIHAMYLAICDKLIFRR